MDIFDSITLLDILFTLDTKVLLPYSITRAITAFGCINYFLPSITLVVLSSSHFGRKIAPTNIKTAHTVLYLLLVNLPYTVLRIWLWHVYFKDISVFLIKNVMMLYVAMRNMWEHYLEKSSADGTGDDTELNMIAPSRSGRRAQSIDMNGHPAR